MEETDLKLSNFFEKKKKKRTELQKSILKYPERHLFLGRFS